MLAVPVAVIVVLIYIVVNISTVSISQLPPDQAIIRIVRNIKSTFHMSGTTLGHRGNTPPNDRITDHTDLTPPLMLPSQPTILILHHVIFLVRFV